MFFNIISEKFTLIKTQRTLISMTSNISHILVVSQNSVIHKKIKRTKIAKESWGAVVSEKEALSQGLMDKRHPSRELELRGAHNLTCAVSLSLSASVSASVSVHMWIYGYMDIWLYAHVASNFDLCSPFQNSNNARRLFNLKLSDVCCCFYLFFFRFVFSFFFFFFVTQKNCLCVRLCCTAGDDDDDSAGFICLFCSFCLFSALVRSPISDLHPPFRRRLCWRCAAAPHFVQADVAITIGFLYLQL